MLELVGIVQPKGSCAPSSYLDLCLLKTSLPNYRGVCLLIHLVLGHSGHETGGSSRARHLGVYVPGLNMSDRNGLRPTETLAASGMTSVNRTA